MQWTVLSGTSTIGHGLHVAGRAQGLTGTERGKVPSAARAVSYTHLTLPTKA